MQAQDSGTVLELPVPPIYKNKSFVDEWLTERGLDRSWGVFEDTSNFTSQKFRIITHDRNGTPRPELSAERIKRPPADTGPRYLNPQGSGVVIYAPKPDSIKNFSNAKEKWIAEGQGKVLALAGLGLPVLGIGGCEMWHPSGDSTRLHTDLEDHIHKGDIVNVVMDGDFRNKDRVRENTKKILSCLRKIGATPRLLNLQAHEKIDDLIASWRQAGEAPAKKLAEIGFLHSISTPIPTATYDEIITRPPLYGLLRGLFLPGELTAIVGESSCGKTFLTLDLLLAIARGEDWWFGHRIKRHGLVVHITLEGTSLGNRLNAYQQHHKISASLPYIAIETPVLLRENVDELIESIRDRANGYGQPVLIAVDTVNRALGGDENNSEHMGEFLAAAEKLKSAFPGCGILLVHHTGKDAGRGARGHSSFSANVGAELLVQHDKDSGTRTISLTKQRDAATDGKISFRLESIPLGKDDDGEEITSCAVAPCAPHVRSEPSDEEAYRYLYNWNLSERRGEPISRSDIARNFGRIKGDLPLNKEQFKLKIEGAINKKLCEVQRAKKNGEVLVLKPPPQRKY